VIVLVDGSFGRKSLLEQQWIVSWLQSCATAAVPAVPVWDDGSGRMGFSALLIGAVHSERLFQFLHDLRGRHGWPADRRQLVSLLIGYGFRVARRRTPQTPLVSGLGIALESAARAGGLPWTR
jgi:hypothetical protein